MWISVASSICDDGTERWTDCLQPRTVEWREAKCVNNLFSSLQITRQRLAKAIVPSPDYIPLIKDRERIFKFLQRLIQNSPQDLATAFVRFYGMLVPVRTSFYTAVRFYTAATVMVVDSIEVSFVNTSGLARRPVAQTCVAGIDLSTTYESYAALRWWKCYVMRMHINSMYPNIAWTFSSLNSDSLNDALLEKYVSVTLNFFVPWMISYME